MAYADHDSMIEDAIARSRRMRRRGHGADYQTSYHFGQPGSLRKGHYRLSVRVGSRGAGGGGPANAVAAAAYRAGHHLHDRTQGLTYHYAGKDDVVYTTLIAPEQAPDWVYDRQQLWNAVETAENRRDAQLFREIQLSLPRELPAIRDQAELVEDFVTRNCVDQGMVADIAIHHATASDGAPQPHAHVMLTMREITPDGFGYKQRDWNDRDVLEAWREDWEATLNRTMERAAIATRFTHLSYERQGLDYEPELKLGWDTGLARDKREELDRFQENRMRRQRNAEREALDMALIDIADEKEMVAERIRDIERDFAYDYDLPALEGPAQQAIADQGKALGRALVAEQERQRERERERDKAREREREEAKGPDEMEMIPPWHRNR